MAIISITGYAGSGKDTVGKMIMDLSTPDIPEYGRFDIDKKEWKPMTGPSPWTIKKWAGKLKTVASLLTGIPVHKFEEQEFKKTYLGDEWSTPTYADDFGMPIVGHRMSVRELLQRLGTDALRQGLHPNTWVNALMADYIPYSARGSQYESEESKWIITDTRFPNEADAVRNVGGLIIKVERPGVGPVNNHPSETSMEDYDFDYVIHNDGDINELENKVRELMNSPIFVLL